MGEDRFAEIHRSGHRATYGCLGTFLVWSFCLILIFTGRKWLQQEFAPWTWLSFAIELSVIFIFPAIGILQAIDLKDYFEWSEKKTPLHWLSWCLIFIGSWLFGWVALACTLMGGGAMINAFNERQWLLMIGSGALTLFLGAVAIYLLLLPFKRFSRETERQDRSDAERYDYELSHPKFSEIEKQTQKTLPVLYQSLFAPESSGQLLDVSLYPLGEDHDHELYIIDRMIPANLKALRQTPHVSGDFLAFAEGDGEEFWIQLGAADPAVYIFPFEEGRVERISERLSVFLSWPKA